MGADGIFQFKDPLFPHYRSAAQNNLRLDTHKLDRLHADDLIDIDTQDSMGIILHPKPQRFDGPVG